MWVTSEDIRRRWLGSTEFPSLTVVQEWIGDAEALILFEFPDIQQRIDDDELPLRQVRLVVAQMVLRVLRNPDNLKAKQQTSGPFSEGGTYAGDNPGSVYLTDDERAMLGSSPGTGQKAFTINGTPATGTAHELEAAWVNGPSGYEPGYET